MIRFWEPRDIIKLRKMIYSFIESQAYFGGEVLPNEENVRFFLDLGYGQIQQNNDPHLVYEEDGDIIAFIQIGEANSSLIRKHKTCELFSMYTKPEHEHRFISIELIRACAAPLVRNGYVRGYSTVLLSNRKIQKNMFYNPAMWPTRLFVEWDLDSDPQFYTDVHNPKFIDRIK